MARELLKGNIAFAEAAVRSGLQAYFGYPITPQTEALEWLSQRMPELDRIFLQAESELGAINMVYGAASCGARVMTSSSSPGISLMMEGISYMAATELPAVIVNVMRGGPGLGNISPAQGDYNQIVHGGGHGDYYPIVLAPSSVQEAVNHTVLAFSLAEKYRAVTFILMDGCIGQMMEPAELPPMQPLKKTIPEWAVRGATNGSHRYLTSIYLQPAEIEAINLRLLKQRSEIMANEVRYKEYYLEDARYAVVGFGTAGRVALSAVRAARDEGIAVGLLRPISLSPFPTAILDEICQQVEGLLVVEMSAGQMLDDVLIRTRNRVPVRFYGKPGGGIPATEDILPEIQRLVKGPTPLDTHPRDRWLQRVLQSQ